MHETNQELRTHSEYLKWVVCTGDGRAERPRGGLRQQRLDGKRPVTRRATGTKREDMAFPKFRGCPAKAGAGVTEETQPPSEMPPKEQMERNTLASFSLPSTLHLPLMQEAR